MAVEARSLSKTYRGKKALDAVCFDVAQGERVGLLGVNGAGKSTLIRILTGSMRSSNGQVRVHGFDVTHRSMDVRGLIGYLPENNPIYPDLYVLEYLEHVAALYDVSYEVLSGLLDRLGLISEAHKRIGQLSKGYRQRVGLAQALVHDPQVLILDEPTTSLDPCQILEIHQLIKELDQEKTLFFSTHVLSEVETVCDRVLLLDRGRLVLDAEVREVLDKYGSMESAFQALTFPI